MTDIERLVIASGKKIRRRLTKLAAQSAGLLSLTDLDPEQLHTLRINLKQLRAWCRLQNCVQTRQRWRRWQARLRKAGHAIGPARDWQMMHAILYELHQHHPDLGPICTTIRAGLTQSNPQSPLTAGSPRLIARLSDFPLGNTSTGALRRALQHRYQQVQQLYYACAELAADSGELHRLRRRVKDLYYQLNLALEKSDPLRASLGKRLAVLGQELGELHDLLVLQQHLFSRQDDSATPAQMQELLLVCEAQIRQHHARAMALARLEFG